MLDERSQTLRRRESPCGFDQLLLGMACKFGFHGLTVASAGLAVNAASSAAKLGGYAQFF
jgi:hypothetical protein